ncbi:Uncharacterised protein [Salmonella enterica subsp. enterica serovar Bovismorbificans]|uniref:Uncharacterized protein n=1 Tax=Salmonella enterica subsp. enterica serovar Bovismorbificans TaxID=58097 RepID=A0A655CHE9_SALET|nr:Uncharacterised protein [Salmonella enterica subsp. enterica serovar Bovismorbificans]CNU79150.1 Uncharacterised protein [Salmonella enterica subsp. enterica serovar Bovismorbificans]
MLWFFLLFINKRQRFQVIVEHLAFFVRQLQERVVQVIHVVVCVLVTHLFHAMFHGGTARAGGQVQLYLVQTDGLWRHDFIVFAVLEDAILVDAGRVGKSAAADNRFVGRDRHVTDLADGLAGAPDFVVIDVGVYVHDVFAHFNRHDHFFQCAVTGTFSDTVHRAFNLTRARIYCRQRVAYCYP